MRINWNPKDWGVVENVLSVVLPGVVAASVLFALYAWTPIVPTNGKIVGEEEEWSLKHLYQCNIIVDTTYGQISDQYMGRCKGIWAPGDTVKMSVRIGRLGFPAMLMHDTIERRMPRAADFF